MDKVIELAKELRTQIDEMSEIKEYYRVKELFEKDEELESMRRVIARLKNEGKEEERKNLLKIYNSHPLVTNYNASKEEAMSILRTIQEIIQ